MSATPACSADAVVSGVPAGNLSQLRHVAEIGVGIAMECQVIRAAQSDPLPGADCSDHRGVDQSVVVAVAAGRTHGILDFKPLGNLR